VTVFPEVARVKPKVAMSVLSKTAVEPGMLAPVQLPVLFQSPAAFAFHESLAAKTGEIIASEIVRNAKAFGVLCVMGVVWWE
jgi:hypothetical protein